MWCMDPPLPGSPGRAALGAHRGLPRSAGGQSPGGVRGGGALQRARPWRGLKTVLGGIIEGIYVGLW